MKKFTRTGKKVLSVFLAVLMVMTAWVFVAPEAEAATAGSYTLEVSINVTNKADNQGNIQDSYYTITYKTNNGTGSQTTMTYSLKDNWTSCLSSTGSKTITITVPGFPTSMYIYHDATWDDKVHYTFNGATLSGPSSSSTAYSGSFNVHSGGWGNSEYKKTITLSAETPKASSVSFISGETSINIPKTGASDYSTSYTAGVYDQYGVRMTYEPTYYVRSSKPTSAQSSSSSIDGVTMTSGTSSGTLKVTSAAQLKTADTKNVYVHAKYGDFYANRTVTLNDQLYKFTFKNTHGGTPSPSNNATSEKKYYNTYGSTPSGTRTGFTFKGYFRDSDVADSFATDNTSGKTKLTSGTYYDGDYTWYAAWQANQYTATFSYKDASYKDTSFSKTQYYTTDLTAPSIPTPINVGDDYTYTFKAWSPSVPSTMPASNNTYTATYDMTTHYADYTEVVKQIGAADAKMAEAYYKEGAYTTASVSAFTTAYNNAVASNDDKLLKSQQSQVDALANALKTARENLTLKKFTVVFIDEDGSIIKNGFFVVDYGTKVTAPAAPTKDPDATYHYTFTGWDSTDSDPLSALNKVTDDLKFIAKFTKTAHTMTDTVTTAAGCQNDGVITHKCSVCGYSYTTAGNPAAHTWSSGYVTIAPATCSAVGKEAKQCTVCKVFDSTTVRDIAKTSHSFGAWTVVEAATCGRQGVQKRTCSICGQLEVQKTAATGSHSYQTKHTCAATCTADGYTVKVCTGCGDTQITKTTKLGHNLSTTTTQAATCASVGVKETKCSRCDYGTTEIIPATGTHTYGAWTTVSTANCISKGVKTRECSVCGKVETEITNATAHSWGSWTVVTPATCTGKGVQKRSCPTCGQSETQETAALGHNFVQSAVVPATCEAEGYTLNVCNRSGCGAQQITNKTPAKGHSWTTVAHDADCTHSAYTEYKCANDSSHNYNKYDETKPALGHDFTGTETVTKAATCTADGTKTIACTRCTEVQTVTIPKLGHNYTAGAAVAPSCTTSGYTPYTCANCGDTYNVYDSSKPATDHAWGDWEVTTAPTNTTAGEMKRSCTVCGLEETAPIPAGDHEFSTTPTSETPATCASEGEQIFKCTKHADCGVQIAVKTAKLPHTLTTVVTDATCTATGKVVTSCANKDNCHMANIETTIPVTAHPYGAAVRTDATCTEAAYDTYTCTACGDVKVVFVAGSVPTGHSFKQSASSATCTDSGEIVVSCDKCSASYVVSVSALGHDFSEVLENVASTCNSVGHITKKCSRCDETETTYSSTLAAHTWGEWETKQEQTDVLPKIEVRQCSVCGVYDYRYTAPSGAHDWDEGQVTTAATCTTDGVKTYTCKRTHCACPEGNPLTYTEVIPATGHSAKVENKEATCTEAGYVKAVCEICHAELDSKGLPMKGHTEKVTVTEPTCTTPGSNEYTCAVCGATTKPTEQIPVVPHAYEATGTYTEATCTTPKYETYKCKYCDSVQLVKVAEANGHTVDDSKTNTVPATCTKAGSVSKYCSCGQLLSVEVLQPVEHSWNTVVKDLPKECEGAKITYNECSVCGAIEVNSVVITESGDHVYKVTTETPATCTAPGMIAITCEHCANVNTKVEIPAVGHTYDSGVITTEQKCNQDGVVTFTCTREGCTDAQSGHTITKNIGTKNHNYVASGSPVPATCTSSSYQLYKCKYCNKEFREILEAPANHIYEKQSTSVEPNCYKGGHYIYKCKNCVASYEYDLPATGNHDIKSEVIQAQSCTLPEITKYTCKTEGCPYDKKEITKSTLGHVWGKWIVTKEPNEETGENGEQVRQCTRGGCTATETAPIPASIHNWGKDPIATTDASCTAAETKTYKCIGCNLCNETNGYKTYVKTIGVPLQHNVVVEYKAATCTAAGSYIAKCSLCGKVFKEETLAATGHSFNTYLQDTYIPATCTVEGSVTYACSNKDCHEIQTTVLPVNPNAHNMVEDPDNSKTATCTTAAYKAYKCANQGCDHMYKIHLEDPIAHTAKDDWTVVRAANCHSDGYKVLECKTCNAILETETIPANAGLHDWKTFAVAADHTNSGYSYEQCSVCGEMRNFTTEDLVEHEYNTLVDKKDATPTENGYVTYACSCGDTITLVVPAFGHSFTSAVTKEPTCTEKGVKTFTCTLHTDCESNYTEDIPALGHLAGDVELTAATCLSEGSATVRCTRESCSVVLHSKKIEKLPHTFNDTNRVVVEPTCQTTGSVTYTCTTAGCTAKLVTTFDKVPHSYAFKESVTPTCLDSGYDVYACTTPGCSASYNVVTTSASGHRFTEDTTRYVAPGCATVGHKYFKCSTCDIEGYDYEVPATGRHIYNVTETVSATCETAGYTYNECNCGAVDNSSVKALDPLGHNYTVDMGNGVMQCERCDKTITAEKTVTEDGVTHAFIGKITKQSTCTEQGIMTYTCQNHADCAKNHTEELPLASHSATAASIVKVEPQCRKDGTLINGSITVNCSVCGTQIGEKISVPAAHKYEVVKVERATCGSKGKVTERCSVCKNERVTELEMNPSAHEFETIPAVNVAATCTTDGYEVYKCKHCDAQKFVMTAYMLNHQHTETVTKDATCEAEGYIRTTCLDCKKLISEKILEKTAHTKKVITIEPTCTNGGTITTKCSVCGKLLEDIVYTNANGHTWGDWVVISGGTCEVEGQRKRVCTVCGETEIISTGVGEHVYPEKGVVTPPTCTTDGFTTYTCTVCKNHSIVKDYVPKLGHVYSNDYKIVIEPTCHSTGSKAHYCINCGSFEQDQSKYIELPKLAHTYGEWVVVTAPTCDTNGVRVRTCTTGCSESDEGHTQTEAVGKIGHNYGEWEVTKKATCVEEGSQRRYCDRCKTWEVQTIPKGGHNRVADNAVEATCTSVGKTAGSHCSLCGYVFVAQKEIPMKDHMDLNGDGKCEGCNMTMHFDDGTDTCLCHGTGFRAFIYKIVRIIWKIFKINKTCVCGAKHY